MGRPSTYLSRKCWRMRPDFAPCTLHGTSTSRRCIPIFSIGRFFLHCSALPIVAPATLNKLRKALEGKVWYDGEEFFLGSKRGTLEFTLLAEGLRKLGLLWLLIQNGTLTEGSILFWDEPETNLNPKLFGPVVEILLELQRQGVQIFVSTHDYLILKQLDLQTRTTTGSPTTLCIGTTTLVTWCATPRSPTVPSTPMRSLKPSRTSTIERFDAVSGNTRDYSERR